MFIQLSLIVVCLYISLQHEHSLYGMAYSQLIVFGRRRNFSKRVGSLKFPPVAVLLASQDRGAFKTNRRPAGRETGDSFEGATPSHFVWLPVLSLMLQLRKAPKVMSFLNTFRIWPWKMPH